MKDKRKKYLTGILILVAIFYAGRLPAAEKSSTGQFLKAEKVEYAADEAGDPFAGEEIEKPVQQQEIKKKPLPELKIQGLIWGGKLPQAIINNKVVMVGDTLEDVRIVEINKDGLILYFEGQPYNLTSPGMLSSKIAQAKPKGGIDEE
ncbi:MAG: general secretion pathway protein GspB [Candidatus Omnitrophota bacterium]